jgi:hypothetical protein
MESEIGIALLQAPLLRVTQAIALSAPCHWRRKKSGEPKGRNDRYIRAAIALTGPHHPAGFCVVKAGGRFKLKVHFETREVPVYTLVVAKDGPKLTSAKDGETHKLFILDKRARK